MKRLIALFLGCSMLTSVSAIAQETPKTYSEVRPENILPGISKAIGQSALQNITGAEQIFCYQITNKPENYNGYTLDGMAIAGFCGIINQDLKNMVITELFANPDSVLFDETEDCIIRPKIMLRFVRGVDTTDVLLSSPCHAFAIFYGGRINAFNAKPAAPIIDALVTPLLKSRVDFASPALFNQLLPVGIAQTEEQKELLNQKNAPIRNWLKKQDEEDSSKPKTGGWNKVNLKLQGNK